MKVLAYILVVVGGFTMGHISRGLSISDCILGCISFLLAFIGGVILVASLVEKHFFED